MGLASDAVVVHRKSSIVARVRRLAEQRSTNCGVSLSHQTIQIEVKADATRGHEPRRRRGRWSMCRDMMVKNWGRTVEKMLRVHGRVNALDNRTANAEDIC